MKLQLRLGTLLLGGVFSICVVGCSTPTVRTNMLLPAKSNEVSQIKRVAVMPFSGREGETVSRDIEASLVGVRVQDAPYFSVIERSALQQVLREQSLQLTGLIDEKTAVKVGKLAGAEGVVLGNVTTSTVQDTGYYVQGARSKISCTKRVATFAFTPKIVSVTTGQVLVADSMAGRTEENKCSDDNKPLTSKADLLVKARSEAVREFCKLVAPYQVTVAITILEKDESKPRGEVADKISAGIEWAKQDRLDRACELWREAYTLHQQGYAIHYNLGLCAELTGRLSEALELYEKADRLTPLPVKEISAALKRVRGSQDSEKKLEDQLRKGDKGGLRRPSLSAAGSSKILQ